MTIADFFGVSKKTSSASPSTDWREEVEPEENQVFEGFAREIAAQQKDVARQTSGPPLRGFHAKLHAGLMAEFHVLDELPKPTRFGVFSEPKVFPAVVRFSNGEPSPHPDRHPEPRGIAVKLIGVPGRKLLPGQEDALTQDFLATSHSVTSTVRNARQFIAFIRAAQNRATLPLTLARSVGTVEAARILASFALTVPFSRVRSMATEQFSGTAPVKMGPFAIKFTIRAAEGTEAPTSRPLTENFLREDLADRLRRSDLVFDFLVQYYVDTEHTPIEDTSVRWEPAHSPFLRAAQIRIPACDLDDPAAKALSQRVNELSFSPWHAIEEHRPLGSIMRARRIAYQHSSALRGHSPEPTQLPL